MADEKKGAAPASGSQKVIGLLGGVSWASSMEYYKFLNEEIHRRLGGAHSAKCVMYSLDLEPYVNALKAGDFNSVKSAIANGCTRLQSAGADFVVLCSNTAHIATDVVGRNLGATTPLLHMADTTAAAVKKLGLTKCGFIGTAFAMSRGDIQIDRLKLHGLEVVVPSDAAVRDRIWHIIESELSHNKQTAESRAFLKATVENMKAKQGVECVILGCTELPMLLTQSDVPSVPLIDTTRVHARYAVDVSLGVVDNIDTLLPASIAAEKEAAKKKKKVPGAAAAGVSVAAATGQAQATVAPAAAPAAAAPAAAPAK